MVNLRAVMSSRPEATVLILEVPGLGEPPNQPHRLSPQVF